MGVTYRLIDYKNGRRFDIGKAYEVAEAVNEVASWARCWFVLVGDTTGRARDAIHARVRALFSSWVLNELRQADPSRVAWVSGRTDAIMAFCEAAEWNVAAFSDEGEWDIADRQMNEARVLYLASFPIVGTLWDGQDFAERKAAKS